MTNVQGLTEYQNLLKTFSPAATTMNSPEEQSAVGKASFGDYVKQAVTALTQKTDSLDQDAVGLITGDETDLGNVMIRMTEAQLSLQTAVQVRNKCLEAYNDVKNMQF